MRHPLFRQELAPEGSQQLWMQDPAPAQRCSTEGSTGHQGREGENTEGNRDGDGGGNENGDGGKYGSGNGDGNESR